MKKLKEIDPQEAVDFLIDQSKPYAKAKSERIYMEEFRKTLKAQLMLRLSVWGTRQPSRKRGKRIAVLNTKPICKPLKRP